MPNEERTVMRLEALMRLLLTSGDITPMGIRQVLAVLKDEGYVVTKK
jgi:hypothetical protein